MVPHIEALYVEPLVTLLQSTGNSALAPSPVILQAELGTSRAQRNVTEQLSMIISFSFNLNRLY